MNIIKELQNNIYKDQSIRVSIDIEPLNML
jgi:hypothetical protein